MNYIGQTVQQEFAFKANYSRFSIFSSGGHLAHQSETVLAILVEGHLSNIPMRFKCYRSRGIGGVDVTEFSIFSSGGHFVYGSGTILAILVGSHLGNIPMKFESHWPKGSGGISF